MKPFKYNPNNNTGTRRHRIAIWRRSITVDELLQEIEVYEEATKRWAMVKTIKGSEIVSGDTSSKNTVRFVIPYSNYLRDLFSEQKTSFEIHYKNVIYDVDSVINDDELNQTYTIVAEGRM